MAPERSPKRQKTSRDTDPTTPESQPTQIPSTPQTSTPDLSSSTDSTVRQTEQYSWYSSWSRKAPPVTRAASDSIKSVTSKASDVAASIKDGVSAPKSVRSPSLAMTLGRGRASRASLADATTTMVHAEAKSPSGKSTKSMTTNDIDIKPSSSVSTMTEDNNKAEASTTQPEEPPQPKVETPTATQPEQTMSRSSWLGWLARGDGTNAEDTKEALEEASNLSAPVKAKEIPSEPVSPPQEAPVADTKKVDPVQDDQTAKRGWFPLWGAENAAESGRSEENKHDIKTAQQASETPTANQVKVQPPTESAQIQMTSQPHTVLSSSADTTQPPTLPHDGTKASAWAFWARDRKANDSSSSVDKPREGEIAVSDTPSQNQPRRASISLPKGNKVAVVEPKKPEPKKVDLTKVEAKKSALTMPNDQPQSTRTASPNAAQAIATQAHKKQDSKSDKVATKAESSNATATAIEPSESQGPAPVKSSKNVKHLLLPDLHATLKFPESPSFLLRLASLFYVAKEPDLSHLSLAKNPPHIKNALAIGVHGYFPTPLIRSVLGQPTGTSIKFADMAAKSIKRWTTSRGYECHVKTAALEGEGKIAERIELLWKLLLNWIEEIRKSDFIMVACHSQGVPVAIMLVAKLIQFGCVSSARVCICAMAGVNMGPFPEYKSRWIGGSAGELFEFSDPSTRVSSDYLAAMDVILKFGVRLTFVGSIDDQLVSLESSVFAPVSHPHIFRAVSIDAKVHAPNFLSHLVGFAFKLRNLGIQDHGLIRELSSPLAGSLYTGEGHSRIYEDDKVYDLAVAFALETTAIIGVPLTQKPIVASSGNPYILPFAMRGILEEDFVKNELQSEASDLLREFDEWKPSSKVLKDVKFRLEGIRSKL